MRDRTVGQLVENLIYLRDKVPMSREDRAIFAQAANLISHNFDRMASVFDVTESGKY